MYQTSVIGRDLGRRIGLEGFWDDVYKVAGTVANVAGTVASVKRGETTVVGSISQGGIRAVPIPTPQVPSLLGGTGSNVMPLVLLGGAALLAVMLLRRR